MRRVLYPPQMLLLLLELLGGKKEKHGRITAADTETYYVTIIISANW